VRGGMTVVGDTICTTTTVRLALALLLLALHGALLVRLTGALLRALLMSVRIWGGALRLVLLLLRRRRRRRLRI